jgi:hypothetical protein
MITYISLAANTDRSLKHRSEALWGGLFVDAVLLYIALH